MMFPDAAGQLCDAAYGCRPSLADRSRFGFLSRASASARRESNYYGSYISSAAWQTSPARLAELRAAGHRCRLCFASDEEAPARKSIIAPTATSAASLLRTSPRSATIATCT